MSGSTTTVDARPKRRAKRVRTPTILQMEAVECGAASLGIIMGFWGLYRPLEELRSVCGVSRDGSKAANIIKAGRQYGLEGKGYRRRSESVLEGPFPSIVFWQLNHFLVVEGANRNRVFLNDPALGPRSVTRDEFDASYSGVVLLFEKGDSFHPGGKPPKTLARIIEQARDYKRHVLFIIFLGLLLAVPGFVIPGFTTIFVNDILVDQRQDWLPPLILALTAAILVQAVLAWLKQATLLRLETASALKRSAEFMWHVLRLPTSFFGLRYLGDIASRVTSVERVTQMLTTGLGGASIDAMMAAVLFVLMALIDPVLAVIASIGALANVLVLRFLQRSRMDAAIRMETDQGKLFAASVVGLRTIETLKATGGEDDFFGKWSGYQARSVNSEQRLARLDQLTAIVPPFVVMLTTAIALVVGGMRVMDGIMTVGALLAFQTLFATLATPVQHMVQTAANSQRLAADLARLDDVFNYQLDWRHVPPKQQTDVSPTGSVGLTLDSISFSYNPLGAPLIQDFSLQVKPGGWVALVGSSGSGKSTIGKLISGLYTPQQGQVLLDGKRMGSFDRRQLATVVATVDQEIGLFAGTVRDNVCLWDRTVAHQDLVAAIRDAALFDMVAAMPGNFDAVIDEAGRNLSGGQRQRIEIARGLVRNPALLILDEATSALDPTTELAVMNALRRRGMSCVIVAHRLSTIRDCDEIIVLQGGRAIERGRHEELMAHGGAYAELIADGEAASA